MTTEFNIDIAGTPLTAAAIENERQRLETRLASITRLGWVVIAGLGLLDAGLWFVWWMDGMTNELLIAALAVAGVFAVAATASVTSVAGIGIGALAGVATHSALPDGDAAIAVGAIAVGAGLASIVIGVTTWHQVAKGKLRDRITQLDLTPKEACVEIATWSKTDPVVDSYCAAVVDQGRQITQGEYQAMQAWIEERSARQEQEERQRQIEQACRDVYGVSA